VCRLTWSMIQEVLDQSLHLGCGCRAKQHDPCPWDTTSWSPNQSTPGSMQKHCPSHGHDGSDGLLSNSILMSSSNSTEPNLLILTKNNFAELFRGKDPIVCVTGATLRQTLVFLPVSRSDKNCTQNRRFSYCARFENCPRHRT